MSINENINFKNRRAHLGDLKSICEMTDYFVNQDNWETAIAYMELMVEFEPSECEKTMLEVTTYHVPYQEILGIIANEYRKMGNLTLAYKWFHKYIDYIDYINLTLLDDKKIVRVEEIYDYLKDNNELYKAENRFLLKWELARLNTQSTQV